MKTGSRLYLSSMIFGLVIAAVYGLWTKELFGTVILAMLGLGLGIVYGYLVLREERFRLVGDDDQANPDAAAGEELETFASRSRWPLIAIVGVLFMLLPLIWVPYLSVVGFFILLWALYGLMREIMPRGASIPQGPVEPGEAEPQPEPRSGNVPVSR